MSVDSPNGANPYDRAGKILNAQDRRNKKLRELMATRVSKNEKAYVWSMGYNNLSARYTDREVPTISGSSLNRKCRPPGQKKKKTYPLGKHYTDAVLRKAGPKHPEYLRIGYYLFSHPHPEIAQRLLSDETGRPLPEIGDTRAPGGRTPAIHIPVYELSRRSRAKIRDKATAFFRATGRRRTFATLSFVEAVADGVAIGILNKFLTQVRKKFPDLQYLWVAERQENGNIHFHMLLNKFLPVGRWNAMWVVCQYNEGLRGHTEEGREISYSQVLDAYYLDQLVKFRPTVLNEKTGKMRTHLQALLNPFDVKKISDVSGLAGYITKYVTKQEQGVKFGCRPWHCSRGISRLFTRQVTSPSTFRYMKSFANWWVDTDTGELHKPKIISGAFWVTAYVCNRRAPLRYLKELEKVNKWLMQGMKTDNVTWLDVDSQHRSMYHKQSGEWEEKRVPVTLQPATVTRQLNGCYFLQQWAEQN